MIKKLLAKLIVNFQPRMNLGEKRFNERQEIERQNARENEEAQKRRIKEDREKEWQEIPIPDPTKSEEESSG